MNVRAVFFDLDDTLCDFQPAWRSAVSATFEMLLAEVPTAEREHVERLWQQGWRDLVALLSSGEIDMAEARARRFRIILKDLAHPDEDLAERLDLALGERMLRELRLYEDADVLECVAATRYVGIVTNGADDEHPDSQRSKATALGLLDKVRAFHASDAVGARKPDPRILLEACLSAQVAPEHALYVGDIPEGDVVAANRAGLTSVLLDRRGEAKGLMGEERPDHVIRSLRELPALLEVLG